METREQMKEPKVIIRSIEKGDDPFDGNWIVHFLLAFETGYRLYGSYTLDELKDEDKIKSDILFEFKSETNGNNNSKGG